MVTSTSMTPEQRSRRACQGASHLEAGVAQEIREAVSEAVCALEAQLIALQREAEGVVGKRLPEHVLLPPAAGRRGPKETAG